MRALRMAFSPARPSRLKNPPGIFPAAYIFSSTSTVSGKKSAPSRPSVRPTTVARTTVPPHPTSTAPCACLAMTPVSNEISSSPTAREIRVASGSTAMLISLSVPSSSPASPAGLILHEPGALAAQAELLDEGAVALQIVLLQIRQEPAPPADHLQQPTARVMVVLVHLHVLRELGDSLGEEGDLDLCRSRVLLPAAETADELRLLLLGKRHGLPSLPRTCGRR